MADQKTALDDKIHWYKDAIIYELHIKAFRDGNGDGVGDFQGLLEKLDYLQELGVTAIWVLPFYPSPLRDDGYDIADYYSINPSYGTIEQFQQFLQEAHNRNLKVITELVINHTSDQHPWFQRARRAPKGSSERAYYVWTDDPNQYQDVRIIFQDYETSNWTWDPIANQYYWHRFFHHQPDLNYDNPLVQEEIVKIIDYWCAMGVDGFRLDAVPYLFEREGTNGENLTETHDYLKKLRAHVDEHFPGTVFLAEANMWPEDSASYFGNGDECHMNYHFPVMPRMFMAIQMEDRYPITDIFDQTPSIPETCQWAIFLRNHDELTLEMVTDEERDYMYKVYVKNPKARINLGIRHRLAPLMSNDRRRIELLNSLLFSLPGTPVLYYGDEIGMGDNFYLGDRDGVRTPMQWSPDRNAGFSVTNPQRLYLPVILDPEYHYESVNVETQRQNTSSLFWFTKRMINMRKRFRAFGRGDLRFLPVDSPKAMAFTRSFEGETLLIVVNLSKFSQPAEVDLSEFGGYQPIELFSKNRFPAIRSDNPYFFTLSPFEYQWFVLQKAHPETEQQTALPGLQLSHWEELVHPTRLRELENTLLPGYLPKTTWFVGKSRSLHTITITHQAELPVASGQSTFILLIEVTYESGLPETYQLPLTFAREPLAQKIRENCPQAILAMLTIGQEQGILCDAAFTPAWQDTLITYLTEGKRIKPTNGEIAFYKTPALDTYCQPNNEPKSKIDTSQPGYTMIYIDNCFVFKLYRKVDRAINSDLEITRFLSEEVKFTHVPLFAGAVEWRFDKDTMVLGMMQQMVENHGDGHSYLLERLHNFIERVLARDRNTISPERIGSLAEPVAYDDLPEDLKLLLGGTTSDWARRLGIRIGEMHLALASGTDHPDFKPEDFSLHYQRSLFAGMQSLVRETFQRQSKSLQQLPEAIRQDVNNLISRRTEVLNTLKRIYAKKFDVAKIRIHGNLQLDQILLTGKDVAIKDFVGLSQRSFSERRIKRSPLRDVASIIRSLSYVAHEGFLFNNQVQPEDTGSLMPFARLWAHYISGFFLKAYFETVRGSVFLPENDEQLQVMLETYVLERAIQDLNHRPDWVAVPLQLIGEVLV